MSDMYSNVKGFNKNFEKRREDTCRSKGTRLEKGKEQDGIVLAKVRKHDGMGITCTCSEPRLLH